MQLHFLWFHLINQLTEKFSFKFKFILPSFHFLPIQSNIIILRLKVLSYSSYKIHITFNTIWWSISWDATDFVWIAVVTIWTISIPSDIFTSTLCTNHIITSQSCFYSNFVFSIRYSNPLYMKISIPFQNFLSYLSFNLALISSVFRHGNNFSIFFTVIMQFISRGFPFLHHRVFQCSAQIILVLTYSITSLIKHFISNI